MKRGSRSDLHGLYQRNSGLIWLCAVIFVSEIGFGAIVPVVPLFARSFGVSQAAIGLTLAVYGLARFILNVPTGQLADRLGRRRTLVLGEVVIAVGNLLCGLTGDFTQFLVFRFIAGAGACMVVTTGQVIMADIATRENRGRLMSVYQGVFLLGLGVGPLPGGLLAQAFGLSAPFIVLAAFSVLAAVVAMNQVPETKGMRERREAASIPPDGLPDRPFLVQLRMLFSQVGFVLLSLVNFMQFYARTGLVFAVVPVMVTVKMGLDPDQVGTALSVASLFQVALVYVAGAMVDRFGRKAVIVPSKLLLAVALACYGLAPDYYWLLAVSAFWGIAGGIAGPAPNAYAADMAPLGMNAITMSTFRAVSDLGYVVGPLLGGWMADAFGNEASLYVTALLFAATTLLFAFFAPETAGRRVKPVTVQPGNA